VLFRSAAPVTLAWQKALVSIDEVFANSYAGGILPLYTTYEQMMVEKRKLRDDEMLAEAVTTSANGVYFQDYAGAGTKGKIRYALTQALARLSKYGAVEIHANAIGLAALYNERDTQERPINTDMQFNPMPGKEINFERIGKAGTFGQASLWVNNGINDDYLITTATGVIAAQTGTAGGGQHSGTAFLLRVNSSKKTGAIGSGQSELEKIQYFGAVSGNGSQAEFFGDQDSIGMKFLGGASVVNNDLWAVVTMPASN
jgi:hypothetical protein